MFFSLLYLNGTGTQLNPIVYNMFQALSVIIQLQYYMFCVTLQVLRIRTKFKKYNDRILLSKCVSFRRVKISNFYPIGGWENNKLTTLQCTTLVHFVCTNVCVLTMLGEDMELEVALLLWTVRAQVTRERALLPTLIALVLHQVSLVQIGLPAGDTLVLLPLCALHCYISWK